MPRFAANLTMLYTEHAFLDRFAAARADGFEAIEYMFPHPFPKEALAETLQRHDLTQVLHNLPAGGWNAGERGIACHPDRAGEFRDGVGRAIEYAAALRCRQVNCLVGVPPRGADLERVRRTAVENLAFAARELERAHGGGGRRQGFGRDGPGRGRPLGRAARRLGGRALRARHSLPARRDRPRRAPDAGPRRPGRPRGVRMRAWSGDSGG